MIISHKFQFIVLLPWKTASQTISLRLAPYNETTYDAFFYFNPYLNRIVHQHLILSDFLALPESKLSYLKAAFVRNPYDRVYSGFKQLQKDILEQPQKPFPSPWIKEHVLSQLNDNLSQLKKANFNFDQWFRLISEQQIYETGRNTNFPLHPCHYWTHYANEFKLDFVGKVEDFEADFFKLQQRLKIEVQNHSNTNVSNLSGNANINPHKYRYTDLMSKYSIDKINTLFIKDFETFSYEMINY